MMASVPSWAPLIPPDTGASRETMFLAPSALARTPATPGPVVDRSTKVLIAPPWITPDAPSAVSWRTAGEGSEANTNAVASATSLGEPARLAPRATSAPTASSLTSNTVSVWPASSSRPAIRLPMRPRPMKPMCSPMVRSSP